MLWSVIRGYSGTTVPNCWAPVIRGGARSGIPSVVAEGLYARGQMLKLGCKQTSTFQSLLEQISIMFNYSGGFQSGKAPPRAN